MKRPAHLTLVDADKIGAVFTQRTEWRERAEKAEARNEVLERAVDAYPEWDVDGFCLACNHWEYEGHNEDCPRAALAKEKKPCPSE